MNLRQKKLPRSWLADDSASSDDSDSDAQDIQNVSEWRRKIWTRVHLVTDGIGRQI